MRLSFEAAPLADTVHDVVDEFASVYDEKDLGAEVIEDGAPAEIRMDRMKVQQVLRNLLSNAGKFSQPGGTVKICLTTHEGFARVTVDDQGVGVPEAELETIFDKFAQASSNRPHAGGTGLGLAICKEIVTAHQGRIWAENRPEGGARFVLELPIAGPAEEEDESPPSPAGSSTTERRAA
jgi:signal transduction histidine kinase